MKQLALAAFLLCLAFSASAQTDSVIQYRKFDAALSDHSPVMDENRRYDYIPIVLQAGDMLHVRCHSEAFVAALIIRDSTGVHQVQQVDDPMMFKTIGSTIEATFKATETAPVFIIVTTKDARKMGDYTLEVAYYNAHLNKVSSSSPFCDKLKYILQHSTTSFIFLRSSEAREGFGKSYDASIQLFSDGKNELFSAAGDSYTSTTSFGTDLQAAQAYFGKLEKEIAACVPGFTKTVTKIEDVSEALKEYFVREVEYEQKGQHNWDMNSWHYAAKAKNIISLKINKSSSGTYKVDMNIK